MRTCSLLKELQRVECNLIISISITRSILGIYWYTEQQASNPSKIDFQAEERQIIQITTFEFTWEPFSTLAKSYISSGRLCSYIYTHTYLMGFIQPRPKTLHDSILRDTAEHHLDLLTSICFLQNFAFYCKGVPLRKEAAMKMQTNKHNRQTRAFLAMFPIEATARLPERHHLCVEQPPSLIFVAECLRMCSK